MATQILMVFINHRIVRLLELLCGIWLVLRKIVDKMVFSSTGTKYKRKITWSGQKTEVFCRGPEVSFKMSQQF